MKKYIPLVPYSDLLKEFVAFYLREYGEIKLNKIAKTVHTSNKVQKFIQKSNQLKIQLGTDDFIGTIHSIIHFTFSKAETIAMASIILLSKWEQDVGKPNNIASDLYLNKTLIRILDKCDGFKTHLSSSPNFFERFHKHIDTAFSKAISEHLNSLNKKNPNYWIETSVKAVKFYDNGFDEKNIKWNEYTFSIFILNCGITYLMKFPGEVHQIGQDYTIEEKNEFINLVLQKAKNFNPSPIENHTNSDFFEEKDRVDYCLKYIALCIDKFQKSKEVKHLNMIAYNVLDEPMLIDFSHREHIDEDDTIDLCEGLGDATTYISNSIL